MHGFTPSGKSYATGEPPAVLVPIADIGPVPEARRLNGIFRDDQDEGIQARDRVLKILRGFRHDEFLPPVIIATAEPEFGHKFELKNGTHRLYCAIAAGFTHVPTLCRMPYLE
jgi:hypothetical protein